MAAYNVMSILRKLNIEASDSGSIDAFGRWRVSEVTTQIDLKQLHDTPSLFIDTETINNGAVNHSTSDSSTTISTTTSGDVVVAQTFQRFNYQSGKGQQIFITFAGFDTVAGQTKRVGYFSSSTSIPFTSSIDGLFLQSEGGTVSINVFKEGTIVESAIQTSWNIDKLNGAGGNDNPSGISIDWSKTQIIIIDFEWLGVGRVRWGVVVDGMILYFHESNHANNQDAVYMSSPNQPLRWEIRQSGATAGEFEFICSTVGSEGAINKVGRILSANTGSTALSANTSGTKYAMLGIQLQSAKVDTLVDIIALSCLGTTNDDFIWELYINPTVAGTFTYNNLTNSSIALAVGVTANTVTGGTLIDSGYFAQNTSSRFNIDNAIRLGMSINGTKDSIVLAITPLSNTLSVYGALTWREIS